MTETNEPIECISCYQEIKKGETFLATMRNVELMESDGSVTTVDSELVSAMHVRCLAEGRSQ